MNEPWFDANAWAWIPGTLFGTLGGLWGAVAGTLAPRGRARGLVLGSGLAFVAIGVAMLAGGLVALATGQPYGIWYGLLLPGFMGIVLFPCLLPVVWKRYREAEERRIQAADLR
jgi:hypothetical protein